MTCNHENLIEKSQYAFYCYDCSDKFFKTYDLEGPVLIPILWFEEEYPEEFKKENERWKGSASVMPD